MDGLTEAIINSLDDAILSVNEQQRIVYLNEAAAHIFHCPRPQALGQPLTQFPALAQVWTQLKVGELDFSGRAPRPVRRLEMEPAEGKRLPLEAWLSRTIVAGKSFVTARFRDITLQQQMEDAVHLARKHQAVGALASGITHDFNNILTAIISQVDLAVHSPECPDSLKANLAYAQTSARRGADMMAKLQSFSRQAKRKFTAVNLNDVVEQVVFVLRHSIDPRIEINWTAVPSDPWQVRGDSNQLMQALVNLGLNARDAMPNGGRLTMSLTSVNLAAVEAQPPRKAGQFVKLTIADTGRGMAPETLARLSEPNLTVKDMRTGLGLGLSITFSVISEHGGWIEAESSGGQGTTFHLYLPRSCETPATPSQPDLAMVDAKTMEGRERILVVDDEEAVRVVMRAVLSYRGYQVLVARDGEDAIQQYTQAAPIDLVLMDLHMPHLNGRDALIRLREKQPQLKAILLSGGLQEQDPDGTMEIDGVRFLPKPFDNAQLVAAVRETLDNR